MIIKKPSCIKPYTQNDAFIQLKADTGATSTYLREKDESCAHNIRTLINGPSIIQPVKTTLQVNKSGQIPLHYKLSKPASSAYIVPKLRNSSLLSIGKLCDDNCTAVFTKDNLFIFKNNELLIQGFRNSSDGLWDVLVPTLTTNSSDIIDHHKTKTQSINYIIQADKCKTDLAKYYHACCFSPCISTLTKAIQNGNFLS